MNEFGGRFGNHLFQYAFLRTHAKNLSTTFYCPSWMGDRIFSLNDSSLKSPFTHLTHTYREQEYRPGFHSEALLINDNTSITGFFQSPQYFDKMDVKKWFTFKEELFTSIKKKYAHVSFETSTAVHIRLGDYTTPQLTFYTPRPFYYKNAIELLAAQTSLIIFSDDPTLSKKYLGEISKHAVFIEGNTFEEDFYLMSQCKHFICSSSSFSWWAAYLGSHPEKKVVVPSSWFVPGCPTKNEDIFMDGWIKLQAHFSFIDHYYIRFIPHYSLRAIRKVFKSVVSMTSK